MAFDCAVLYDIENLTKGYPMSAEQVEGLSLRTVLNSVRHSRRLTGVAVQRAYADWSGWRLRDLRHEINDLGIDPIQIFGFGNGKKNAADIQLAIDAVDLAHVRPAIRTFVIVSGDGGFASLVKKLHEYGKEVIVCAYRRSTNRHLEAVADEFIEIAEPPAAVASPAPGISGVAGHPRAVPNSAVSSPPGLVQRLGGVVAPVADPTDFDVVIGKLREVIAALGADVEAGPALRDTGLALQTTGEMFRVGVPGLDPATFGFGKFLDLIRFAATGTPVHVRREGTELLLIERTHSGTAEPLPDLGDEFFGSVEHCLSVLSRGAPRFNPAGYPWLEPVANWLDANRGQSWSYAEATERLVADLDMVDGGGPLRAAFSCFISAEVFRRTPEGAPVAEQTLHFGDDRQLGPAELVAAVHRGIEARLVDVLGSVDPAVLRALISP